MPFTCNICAEESMRICARCTKDTCGNHLCEKCLRCSDCCECEVMLAEPAREMVRPTVRAMAAHVEAEELDELELQEPEEEPDPEPHPEPPEPDPLPPAPREFGTAPASDGPLGP